MDPTYPPEAQAYREKIQAFLAEHLPAEWKGVGALPLEDRRTFGLEWREILRDNKLLALSWPTEYGGPGLSPLEIVIVAEEFTRAGVPSGGANDAFSIQMVGNTLIHWGTEEQKQQFIPRIINGDDVWCQGYSEPNAGSDLGNLGCKAVLDGDQWVINGQKIWTSAGQWANWIFLLTRTDPDARKHRGISFMLVPMDQPGVEVRPIKMINGDSDFNEVFFTDAVTARENVVGEVNGGWAVAMTLLGYERGWTAATVPITYRLELDRLIELARIEGVADDPIVRQRLAWCHTMVEVMRFSGLRTLTSFLAGKAPGPEGGLSKLYHSEYHRTVTELAVSILGPKALTPQGSMATSVFGPDSPGAPPDDSLSWTDTFMGARAGTIYAGSSEIQRNIIGEMVLGLPKEPRADSGAWKDIPK
jgi:alkylation response protein AidB-like acyl-CoA dehydrogenase